ncbi:MAG: hypothetical protein ACXAB4_01385, partial [Candidatus Hodarchaeales archaeon]
PSIATYPVLKGEFRIVYPEATRGFFQNLTSFLKVYIGNGVVFMPRLLIKYFLIPSALFVPLFSIYGLFKFESKWKWVLLLNCLMLVFLYNVHYGYGWPQYGARYYYSGFVSLVILATIAFKYLIETLKNKNLAFYFLVLILCTHFIFSFLSIISYSNRFKMQLAIMEDINNSCPDNSIVLLNEPEDIGIDFGYSGEVKRNPFMETSRLITINGWWLNLDQIKSNFPNRYICHYNFGIFYDVLEKITGIEENMFL